MGPHGEPLCSRKIQENQLLRGRIGAVEIAQDGGNDLSSGTLCSVKRNSLESIEF